MKCYASAVLYSMFYINYEEFKESNLTGFINVLGSFILTMRNLKFNLRYFVDEDNDGFILTMRNLKGIVFC